MINFLQGNNLLLAMVVLPLTILAHNLFGAAYAGLDSENKFSKEVLKKGLTKGALVYSGILTFSLVFYLMSDLKVELAGELYTLVDAMYVIVLAAITNYSTQGVAKLAKIMNYKTTGDDVDEGE